MKGRRSVYRVLVGIAAVCMVTGTVSVAGADGLPAIYDTTEWTTFAVDENGTNPGAGGQAFDAEYLAYKLDGNMLSLGLQTGFDLSDGHQVYSDGKDYYAGDLALSFDGAVTLGDATSYEYAVDFGFLTKDYDGDLVGGSSGTAGIDTAGVYGVSGWNNDIYYTASNPFAMESGTFVSGFATHGLTVGNSGESYFRFVSFDVSSLGLSLTDGLTLDAHWTMSCGNDTVNGQADVAPVPEPATMLLFGTGFAGLAGILRRKKQMKD